MRVRLTIREADSTLDNLHFTDLVEKKYMSKISVEVRPSKHLTEDFLVDDQGPSAVHVMYNSDRFKFDAVMHHHDSVVVYLARVEGGR